MRRTLLSSTCSLFSIGLDLFYAFVIVTSGRRDLVWINVTTTPAAAARRLQAAGIRDKPAAAVFTLAERQLGRAADRIDSAATRAHCLISPAPKALSGHS